LSDRPDEPGDPLRFVPAPGPSERRGRPPGWWRDFWLGFFGIIALNVVLGFVLSSIAGANLGDATVGIVTTAPWVVNLVAIVVLGIVRLPALFGALTAYAVAFGLVILAGILLAVVCFSGGGGVP
jgi:hypothetical protein